MSNSAKRIVRAIVPAVLFVAALWVLDGQLQRFHYRDIVRNLRAIPASRLELAAILTVLNYFVLMAYDALALRFVRQPLSWRKTALVSFISSAFSQSLGFPVLTGASVRYRLYSHWGIPATEIAKIIGFTTVTFWLGVLTLGGPALLVQPSYLPAILRTHFSLIGVVPLATAAAYLCWSAAGGRPIHVRKLEFAPPPPAISLAQTLISTLDWALAAGVLYALLPASPDMSFPHFLALFLIAQILGVASHVPGGLGIFESTVLLAFTPDIPASAIIGSLVVYRIIYYLGPLLVSILLFASYEVLRQREAARKWSASFEAWARDLIPPAFAAAVFTAGVVLLFSGATPTLHDRLQWLEKFLPLSLLEVSHFLASLAGVGLLILARGLQRKLDAAYFVTTILLALGFVASIGKGLDYEEASLMLILLAALVPCRRYFYRKASIIHEPLTAEWTAAIVIALVSSVWLTLFSYKHIPYSTEMWWHFTFRGDAPRSLRAAAGAFGIGFLFAVSRLLKQASPGRKSLSTPEIEQVRGILRNARETSANLALLGDKQFLFSDSGQTFLMYGIQGRSWIALGDPVGLESEMKDLLWKFRETVDRHGGWTIFYEVQRKYVHLYLDLGLTLVKLGEEARVPLEDFSLAGNSRKTERHLLNKLEKDGYTFEIIPPGISEPLLETLKEISDEWLQQRSTREKRFSLGYFDPDYLQYFPVGVVKKEDTPCAFVNIWTGADQEEFSVDLMRYNSGAPAGIMDFLFLRLFLWGKEQGYRYFNFGMAPFSGLENRALAPAWMRLGSFLYRHGEHFYHFQGLRQYKEKFNPVWEPKYMASPGGLALPRILANVGALISGGVTGVIRK